MGIIKFKKKIFLNQLIILKIKNYKFDMTFLNLCIENKIISLSYFLTSLFWYEIDTPQDLKNLRK